MTERLTMTLEEAAKALGIGRNQGYAAAQRGEIPVIKIGKRLLVPIEALNRMLELTVVPIGTGYVKHPYTTANGKDLHTAPATGSHTQ